jgi:zinc protease
VKYPTGKIEKTVLAGSEPKSHVSLSFSAPDPWTREGAQDAQILGRVLDIRLREVLREDLGGVYGVEAYGYIGRIAPQRRRFSIQFGCDPDNVTKLRTATFDVIHAIQKSGIGDDYLAKVREQLRREHETEIKENYWWSNRLYVMQFYGDAFKDVDDTEATLARVTSANVQAAAKHMLDEKNLIVGVLKPKKK